MSYEMKPSEMTLAGVVTDTLRIGAGQQLLFLHSDVGPATHSSKYLELLAEKFDVIAPWHPGFGRRDRPPHIRNVSDLAYFYLDFLDQWKLCDVVLVGASLGGWIACEMAIRSTARIARIVLVDPFGIKAGGREERDFIDFWAVSPAERAQLEFCDPRFATLSYDKWNDEELGALARGRQTEAAYGWQPFMHNPQLIHWLHRIDVPTLLLRGKEDRIVAASNHAAYLSRIPNCSMQIIDRAGHHPHIDAAETFAAAVIAFAVTSS